MARTANRFINPATAVEYAWAVNHREEDDGGQERSIERGAPTGAVGLVRQQGDESPLTFRYKGTILTEAQLETMIDWYVLCRTQTIYFRDFAGDEYEVVITGFKPRRIAVVQNKRDLVNAPLWKWEYEIAMEVLTVRSGPWVGITP